MKEKFTQNWRYAEQLARHAWRCYLNRPDVTVDRMTRPSYEAWIACNTVWNRLRPFEQEMVRTYCRTGNEPSQAKETVRKWASEHGMQEYEFMRVIKRAYKLWAVERGLADMEGDESEQKEQGDQNRTQDMAAAVGEKPEATGQAEKTYSIRNPEWDKPENNKSEKR